jgi:hypothetical protein
VIILLTTVYQCYQYLIIIRETDLHKFDNLFLNPIIIPLNIKYIYMCQFPPISYSFEAMPVPAVATKGSTAVECYIKPHIRITVSSHNKSMYSGYSIHLNRFNNELLFSSQYNHAASFIHSQQVSLLVSLV